jgi:hypothetical protein
MSCETCLVDVACFASETPRFVGFRIEIFKGSDGLRWLAESTGKFDAVRPVGLPGSEFAVSDYASSILLVNQRPTQDIYGLP